MNATVSSDQAEFEKALTSEEDASHLRHLRILFWCIALVFGFVQAWNNRHVMNSDGICYLDLADAYLSGGWKMLLNGHWSPLYPWLLAISRFLVKPPAYREFTLGATIALLFALGIPLVVSAANDFHVGMRHRPHPQWEIAQRLHIMGVQPGDSVGRIGGAHRVEWARLLSLRVIAEIPREQAEYFRSSSDAVQSQVLASFRTVGAKAIIAEQMDPAEVFVDHPGWRKIGDSRFSVYLLTTSGLSR
jgi:hypothetical protein